MDRKRAIEVLDLHNKWISGDNIPNSIAMDVPTEVCQALDYAIKFLSEHQSLSERRSAWWQKNKERLNRRKRKNYKENRYSINQRIKLRYRNDDEFRQKQLENGRRYRLKKKLERMEKQYGPGEFDKDGKYIVFQLPDPPEEKPRFEQLKLFDGIDGDNNVQESERE